MLSLVSRAKANSPFRRVRAAALATSVGFGLAFAPMAWAEVAAAADAIGAGGAVAELRAAGQEGDAGGGQHLRHREGRHQRRLATRPRIRTVPVPIKADRSRASRNRRSTSSCATSSSSRASPSASRASSGNGRNSSIRSASRWARASSSIRRGYVVTNNHVVAECRQGDGDLPGQQQASGEGRSAATPRPIWRSLKIDAPEPLPYVQLGRQQRRRRSATGCSPSAIRSVSAARSAPASSRRAAATSMPALMTISCRSTPRSTAAIPAARPSISTARSIGINTAIYSPNGGSVGIGFAIPSSLAKPVIEQLKEHGKVERGWLGVQIQEVTPEIAKSLGLPKPRRRAGRRRHGERPGRQGRAASRAT